MTCEHVDLPGGGYAIVCSRTRIARCICGRPHTRLCDWKLSSGKTCDKKLCDRCTSSSAPDEDLCPKHREESAQRQVQQVLL